MAKPADHFHKFMRVKMGKDYIVYKCVQRDCPTFMRPELVIGRTSLCWRCLEPMIMAYWHTQYKKPHCRNCTREHPNPARRAKPRRDHVGHMRSRFDADPGRQLALRLTVDRVPKAIGRHPQDRRICPCLPCGLRVRERRTTQHAQHSSRAPTHQIASR